MSRLITVFCFLLVACNTFTWPTNAGEMLANRAAEDEMRMKSAKSNWFWRFRPSVERLENEAAEYDNKIKIAKSQWFWRFRPSVRADIAALTAITDRVHDLLKAHDRENTLTKGKIFASTVYYIVARVRS